VPFVDRDLAGEDGRAAAVAILEDLVEIVTGAGVEGFKAPIIEDQQLNPSEAAQDPSIASVTARQGEVGEQLGHPLIEHRAVVTTGLVAESAGQPALADAGGPAQEQIVVRVDPFAAGELLEQGAVETARRAIIDVLDNGVLAQPGIAQASGQALVAAVRNLVVEQQPQPVGVAERRDVAAGLQLGKGLRHAGKAELVQLVERGVGEQLGSP
jgi:hypothetical protein